MVRRIFNLCIAGKGSLQIAKILTADKVLTVTAYHTKQKGWTAPENLYRWNTNVMLRILERREYTGCTVKFKTYAKSLKFKKRLDDLDRIIRHIYEDNVLGEAVRQPVFKTILVNTRSNRLRLSSLLSYWNWELKHRLEIFRR